MIWGAVLGVTFQFFINMEIERYTLAKGESVFVGFARRYKYLPFWFILSTFFAWIWPGIIAISAKLLQSVIGVFDVRLIGIAMMIIIGAILTVGSGLYKKVEKISTILISVAVPAIFILAAYIATKSDWTDLSKGIVNFPQLPAGVPFASFLAAFAFAGAGGNLNLAQSFYIKEKGYGMGKYGSKISSILADSFRELKLEGSRFEINSQSLKKFNDWWEVVNLEHFLVFWLGGTVSILMLSLLAYATTNNMQGLPSGVSFIIYEAAVIGQIVNKFVGALFLVVGSFMLFNTQLTVLDATSRIMAENFLILKKVGNLAKFYYVFLWTQIAFGIIILLFEFDQPLLLLTISAVLNAIAMFVHVGLTLNLNIRDLEKEIRPNLFRIVMVVVAFLFFGYFSFRTIAAIF